MMLTRKPKPQLCASSIYDGLLFFVCVGEEKRSALMKDKEEERKKEKRRQCKTIHLCHTLQLSLHTHTHTHMHMRRERERREREREGGGRGSLGISAEIVEDVNLLLGPIFHLCNICFCFFFLALSFCFLICTRTIFRSFSRWTQCQR